MIWPARVRFRRIAELARGRSLGLGVGISVGRAVGIGPGVRVRVARGGQLEIHDEAYLDEGVVLQVASGARLVIGSGCFLGHHCTVAAEELVVLGDGAFLGELVSVRDHDHVVGARPRTSGVVTRPVTVGRDVWIGAKATVLRGVTVGEGAVIGAHALVRIDVPVRSLAAGIPATIRRTLDPERPRK
jgi:acetyltransferase-like isoleucine patch superfamily enzyme